MAYWRAKCGRACVQASLARHSETRRSTSVEVAPTTSTAEPPERRPVGARSVERLHEYSEAVVTPLLATTSPPRAGARSGVVQHARPPARRPDVDQPPAAPVTRRNNDKESSSKSSSSGNGNNHATTAPVERPPAADTPAGTATPSAVQYVEFEGRTTTVAAVVEAAPPAAVSAAEPVGAVASGPHEYCYTIPPTPSAVPTELELVVSEVV